MNNFITTADIHLWIKSDVPKAWQISRYMELFSTLIELCQKHQAGIIIAGDLFERAEPTQEEQELALIFFRMLNESGIEVWLVSGNHETIKAGVDTFKFLDTGIGKTVRVNYGKFLSKHFANEGVSLHFVNHCDLPSFPKGYDGEINLPLEFARGNFNILISHFRCNVNMFIREEINVDRLLEPFDLCLAGDIHSDIQVGDKLFYTNAPINKEFEAAPKCGVILLSIKPGGFSHTRIPLNLPALIKVVGVAAEPLPALNDRDYYRVELTGTVPELRAVEVAAPNVKLVKIPTSDEVVLEMPECVEEPMEVSATIDQELVSYMQVLGYEDEKIGRMMSVFSDAA